MQKNSYKYQSQARDERGREKNGETQCIVL